MKKLFAVVRAYTLDALTYRGDVLIFTLTGAVHPFILLIIWLAVIASGGNPPLSRQEFLLYYFAVLVVKVWTTAWHAREWSIKIRLGELSPYLLKPTSFSLFLLGNNIGEKLLKTAYLLPLILLAGAILKVNLPHPSILTILLLAVSWLLAAVLTFAIELSILLTTFWLDDIESLDNFVVFSTYVFSGHFIPLIAFPAAIRTISLYFPFRYTLSLPVEIITGNLVGLNLAAGFAIQIFWCAVMLFICKIMWRKGLIRYSAVGA